MRDLHSERGWTNQPLVRERDRGRVRKLWKLLLGMVVAFFPLTTFLVNQNECLQIRYQVGRLEGQARFLEEQERLLRLDAARLETLEGIEMWAGKQRALVKPGAEGTIVVEFAPTTPTDLVAGSRSQQTRSNGAP